MRVPSVQEENVSPDVLRNAQPRATAARSQTPRRFRSGRKPEVCCRKGLASAVVSTELRCAAEDGPKQHPFYEQVAGADEQGDLGLPGEQQELPGIFEALLGVRRTDTEDVRRRTPGV